MNERKEVLLKLRLENKLTLQEIGDLFGITRERVRQIIGNTGFIAKTDIDKAVEFADPKLTVEELAAKAGVQRKSASFAFAKMNMRHSVSGSGAVKKGFDSENAVCSILECAGFCCEKQTYGTDFDILINGTIKVDVKSAYTPKTSPSLKNINPTYRFDCKNGKQADFYIFYVVDTNDIFVVPMAAVKSNHVVFTWPTARPEIGKYQKYHNRFDLLWKAIEGKKAQQ